MEVFFSPINQDQSNNCNSYFNFSFIKFYNLNILCDCPLICKDEIDFGSNKQLFEDLDLDQLHNDTLFPVTFLYNNKNNDDKIYIDLILISNPRGLIGVPFLLHYNKFEQDCHFNLNSCENENNLYKWIAKHPSIFDITKSTLLVTPPVYQSTTIALQQMIEYYSKDLFNNIIDPFLWLKTSDLFGIVSSKNLNNNKYKIDDEKNNNDDAENKIKKFNGDFNDNNIYNYDLHVDKESLKIRHKILFNLPENGPEYYYSKFDNNDDILRLSEKYDNCSNIESISRGSTTGLGAAINAASHIFDGNIGQNVPATIGFNTSNSNTSHPPLFGQTTGEELSYYPRSIIENNCFSRKLNDSKIGIYDNNFQIKIIHIGEIIQFNKGILKFNIHSFNSGFCLGGVGYHITTANMDFDPNKSNENLTIIGPVSLELERYPAPLCLNSLLDTHNVVYYGNYLNKNQLNNVENLISIKNYIIKQECKELNKPLKDDLHIDNNDNNNKNNNDNNSHDNENTLSIVDNGDTEKNKNVAMGKYSDFYQSQIDNIVNNIINTLENYGSVLIPVDCFGLFCLELVEYIGYKISELSASAQAPIYIVGGGFSTLILNADISSEWTTPSRTRKVMLPNPNPPFLFSFLKKSNRLYIFHTIEELSVVYREPAIFIASNSNLKFGPCKELFNMLCNKPENMLLLIDNSIFFSKFLSRFQVKPQINILYLPLFVEPDIFDLIDNITIYHNQNENKFNFIIPNSKQFSFSDGSISNSFKNSIKLIPNTKIIKFNKENRIFSCSNNWIPIKLSSDITENTLMKKIDSSLFVGENNCTINFNQGEFLIEQQKELKNKEVKNSHQDVNNMKMSEYKDKKIILFGKITIKSFLKELKDNDINEVIINNNDRFGEQENVTSLEIPSLLCKIIILSSNNFIISTKVQESRDLIYNIISSLLTSV